MDEYAVVIITVVGVATDVITFLHHEAAFGMLGAQSLRGSETGKTCSHDEVIKVPRHGMRDRTKILTRLGW